MVAAFARSTAQGNGPQQVRSPWVSRALYDAALSENGRLLRLVERGDERYEKLVNQVVSLKRKGFETPFNGQRVKAAAAEPEATGLARAEGEFVAGVRAKEREFLENAEADLINKGADPVAAKREARRLLDEVTEAQPR